MKRTWSKHQPPEPDQRLSAASSRRAGYFHPDQYRLWENSGARRPARPFGSRAQRIQIPLPQQELVEASVRFGGTVVEFDQQVGTAVVSGRRSRATGPSAARRDAGRGEAARVRRGRGENERARLGSHARERSSADLQTRSHRWRNAAGRR